MCLYCINLSCPTATTWAVSTLILITSQECIQLDDRAGKRVFLGVIFYWPICTNLHLVFWIWFKYKYLDLLLCLLKTYTWHNWLSEDQNKRLVFNGTAMFIFYCSLIWKTCFRHSPLDRGIHFIKKKKRAKKLKQLFSRISFHIEFSQVIQGQNGGWNGKLTQW